MPRKSVTLLIILFLSLIILNGCIFSEVQLETPEVVLSQDHSYITWDTNDNAVFYEVIINGTRHIIRDDNVFYFEEGGDNYNVLVKAIGDGIVFKSSKAYELNDVALRVKLRVESFTLRREIDNLIVEWDSVDNAIGYLLTINGVEYELNAQTLSYIYDMGNNYDTYQVMITAIASSDGYFADSEESQLSFEYSIPKPAQLAKGEKAYKDYDKSNTMGISFAIDYNDDTVYNLSGNNITDDKYTYDGSFLTIYNDYLRSLDIGEWVFEFSTEQYSVILTVNVSDSRTPRLATTSVSFNLENNDNADVSIGIIPNAGTFNTLLMNKEVLEEGVDYYYDNDAIVFTAEKLYEYEIGEYNIEFVFLYNNSDMVLSFILHIIDTTLPYSMEISKTFNKANPYDIDFKIELYMQSFEGIQGEITEDDWKFQDGTLTIYSHYLMSRPQGKEEYFIVYTSANAFYISIDIEADIHRCYDIHIDEDLFYPYLALRWEYSGYQEVYYEINGGERQKAPIGAQYVKLSSVDKSRTFTYKVGPADGEWSELMTWAPKSGSNEYLNKSYQFMGETYDYYMGSQEELYNFLYYACYDKTGIDYSSKLPGSDKDNIYGYKIMPPIFIGFDYTGDFIGQDDSPVNKAIKDIPLSGITISAPQKIPDNMATITVIYNKETDPYIVTEGNNAEQINHYPSHIEELLGDEIRDSLYDDFTINNVVKTQFVETSEQLFLAVQAGVKPIPKVDSAAERIYNKAKDVLRYIITDDMSDYAKIHSIYDWLIHSIEYDMAMLRIFENPYHEYNDPSHVLYQNYDVHNCFYLEGVFDDNLAVCDGFAKAFVLLTRIEGLKSIKVNGYSKPLNGSGYIAHAWNKVELDNRWYVVDSTWGNVSTIDMDNNTYEYMSHSYLLVSDIDIYGTHIESEPTVAAPQSYDYYKKTYYDDDLFKDLYIESIEEFQDMINTLVLSGQITYIEFFNATGIDCSVLLAYADIPIGVNNNGFIPIIMNGGSVILVSYK